MKSLTFILPIHNCATMLRSNVQLLIELLPSLTSEFQIVIVDDGSDDGSDDIAAALADRFPQVSAIFHSSRRGERAAIDSGLNLARNELTFVQATDTIEEHKIRNFLAQDGMIDQATEAEYSIEKAERKRDIPTRVTSDAIELRDVLEAGASEETLVEEEREEQHLVERLMQWGTALREYQKKGEYLYQSVPAETPQEEQKNSHRRGIDLQEIEKPEIDLENLELSEKELQEIELLNSMSQSVKLVNKSIQSTAPLFEVPRFDRQIENDPVDLESTTIEPTTIDSNLPGSNGMKTEEVESEELLSSELLDGDITTGEETTTSEDAKDLVLSSKIDDYEVDSFYDAPWNPNSLDSGDSSMDELSSLYASSAFDELAVETRLDALTDESRLLPNQAARHFKLAPPKYSSVPEMRLARLSQRDIQRKSQTAS